MGVGYIQLLTVGSESTIFNYNPNISFFKIYYRRHTNFFITNTEITGNQISIDSNNVLVTNNVSFTIPKNGDLLSKSYINLTFDTYTFELFNYNNELISTLNTNILSLYDNCYIKINNYSIQDIKMIFIVKLNYYNTNNLNIPILTLVSSYIKNYNDFISILKNSKFINLETDKTNIFYNIDLNLKFYSFDVLNITNIKYDNLFNYLYNSIDYNTLNYIQIDFQNTKISIRTIYFEKKYYELLLQLLYSDKYVILINKIKIDYNYIYYSIVFNNELYKLLFDLFYINTKKLELEIIIDKIKSSNVMINDNISNKMIATTINKQ